MKRILVSGIIAIVLHLAFFASLSIFFKKDNKPFRPQVKSVLITMSYRHPAPEQKKVKEKPVKKKNLPASKPKIKTILKKQKPAKIEEPQPKPEAKSAPELIQKNEVNPESLQTTESSHIPEPDRQKLTNNSAVVNENHHSSQNKKLFTTAKPLYKKNPLPKYPKIAKKRGYQGIVELMVQVSEEGKVMNLWIFKSSNYKSLDSQAVKTVKTWLFEPAQRDGQPEQIWVKIPIRFEIN